MFLEVVDNSNKRHMSIALARIDVIEENQGDASLTTIRYNGNMHVVTAQPYEAVMRMFDAPAPPKAEVHPLVARAINDEAMARGESPPIAVFEGDRNGATG